jgi:hypothetical protein
MRITSVTILTLALAAPLTFAGESNGALARECENGLRAAGRELDIAKAKGLGGTWEITKEATLLTGAKVQSEFGKYPNCIDKVRRARAFIARSRK